MGGKFAFFVAQKKCAVAGIVASKFGFYAIKVAAEQNIGFAIGIKIGGGNGKNGRDLGFYGQVSQHKVVFTQLYQHRRLQVIYFRLYAFCQHLGLKYFYDGYIGVALKIGKLFFQNGHLLHQIATQRLQITVAQFVVTEELLGRAVLVKIVYVERGWLGVGGFYFAVQPPVSEYKIGVAVVV